MKTHPMVSPEELAAIDDCLSEHFNWACGPTPVTVTVTLENAIGYLRASGWEINMPTPPASADPFAPDPDPLPCDDSKVQTEDTYHVRSYAYPADQRDRGQRVSVSNCEEVIRECRNRMDIANTLGAWQPGSYISPRLYRVAKDSDYPDD